MKPQVSGHERVLARDGLLLRAAGPGPGADQRHLMIVLREYGDCCSTRRPRRALEQAAPLRQLPGGITGLDQFRVRRRDRAGGVIHEYRLGA